MGNVLEVISLSGGYNGHLVLKDVSLSVTENDFVGIIGPNGAGKTTLFRILTGVIRPKSGSVIYKGKDIMQIPLREIAKEVAILPQILNIPFSFTVWEIVSMGRFPHNGQKARDKEVVENAMRTMDILRLQSRRVSELSGGERQRVLLAQALAQTPKLLLLDEPTAQLDIGHKVEILEVVRRLNREEGLTVLMNLHDLNLASEYCSNLVLLNQGKIEKTGRPEEILTAEIIEKVYKAGVLIDKNPVSGKPHIFPNVRS